MSKRNRSRLALSSAALLAAGCVVVVGNRGTAREELSCCEMADELDVVCPKHPDGPPEELDFTVEEVSGQKTCCARSAARGEDCPLCE